MKWIAGSSNNLALQIKYENNFHLMDLLKTYTRGNWRIDLLMKSKKNQCVHLREAMVCCYFILQGDGGPTIITIEMLNTHYP